MRKQEFNKGEIIIYQSKELKRSSTVAKIATVQIEGNREIKRKMGTVPIFR